MTLRWRCIDCNSKGSFIVPDAGAFPLEDAYGQITSQHIAALLPAGRAYIRGVSPPSPMDDVVTIAFTAPGKALLRAEGGRLVLETEYMAEWPQFEVRHVR